MSASKRRHEQEEAERPTIEGLYREWGRYVLRLLRRLGVREADSEDAAHDVFLIVLRRLPEYEPRGRLIGWLGAIASHVATKYREKHHREPLMIDDSDSVEPPDAPDSEQSAADRDLVQRLLNTLEPDRCTVYVLHELEGVPIPDVARALNIPEGTAWNRLRLAKQDMEAAYKRLHAGEHAVVPLFGLEQLIEMERRAPPPSWPPGMEERVWARLQRAPEYPREGSSGSGAPSPPHAPSALPPVGGALGKGALLTLGGVLVVLGIVIGALWDPLHRPLSTSTAAVAATAPPSSVPVALSSAPSSSVPVALSSAPSSSVPVALSSAPSSSVPVALSSAPSSSVPVLPSSSTAAAQEIAAERALLRRAADALAKNDPDAALEAAQEHAERFRRGQLAEEREANWITALHRAGRTAEARARLNRFAGSYPHSNRLAKLREALGRD